MFLSESYKNRLCQLAGLVPIEEAIDMATKKAAFDKSSNRVRFDLNMMKQAIEQGKEVGINFQSDNDKYKMPTVKSRIIWPVALGTDRKGDLVVRAYHIAGQSEKKAIETGSRTAEASDEWRLFKVKNIKTMWLTDRNFSGELPGYKSKDSAMISQVASYDPVKAKKFQDAEAKIKKNQQPIAE